MVLTVSFVLSPVTGLFCHRRRRNCFRQLDASVGASGPHDFAVREVALSSAAPFASTASRPAFVTIASRPSVGRDGASYKFDLPDGRSEIFSQTGLDRQRTYKRSDLPVGQISWLFSSLRGAIATKQSIFPCGSMNCFVASLLAMYPDLHA